MRGYLELLWAFFVIGGMAFGGGYTVVPLLDRELVKKRGWITMDEVLDFYTIAQITPGVIIVNIATFVGCKRKGVLGGIVATTGFLLPGICLLLIVSMFFRHFAEYRIVQHAMVGIRLAVCALMLDIVIKLVKGFFRDYKAVIVSVAAFVLSAAFSANPVLVVLGAGVAGLLFYSPRRATSKGEPPKGDAP